ncbi:hypothetical protein CCR75_001813 [Bremia lactucae]|uniref:Protein kinase domain-containing protein n=1 Tax=Bremia lactucae TaxID=4779 RepID=A0A976FF45_BRELC|nr:hypothetical protein CCR75_001813 [Bremia lactucae]
MKIFSKMKMRRLKDYQRQALYSAQVHDIRSKHGLPSKLKVFVSPVTGGVLGEELARGYLSDMLLGLQYLHHRDIKVSDESLGISFNCLINGFMSRAGQYFSNTRAIDDIPELTDPKHCWTYQFIAPECCFGEPYDLFKVDTWGVGIVFFIFLFGKLPYASDNLQQLFDEISRSTLKLPETELSRSPECQNLLHRLLQKELNQRSTIIEIQF